MPRAKNLKFKGTWEERKDADGNVLVAGYTETIGGVPASDLDEDQIKLLSDELYNDALGSGLYVDPDAAKSDKKASAPRKRDRAAERARAAAKSAPAASDTPAAVDEGAGGSNADEPRAES